MDVCTGLHNKRQVTFQAQPKADISPSNVDGGCVRFLCTALSERTPRQKSRSAPLPVSRAVQGRVVQELCINKGGGEQGATPGEMGRPRAAWGLASERR